MVALTLSYCSHQHPFCQIWKILLQLKPGKGKFSQNQCLEGSILIKFQNQCEFWNSQVLSYPKLFFAFENWPIIDGLKTLISSKFSFATLYCNYLVMQHSNIMFQMSNTKKCLLNVYVFEVWVTITTPTTQLLFLSCCGSYTTNNNQSCIRLTFPT